MEMYAELIEQRIKEISKMIFDIDEMLPDNETQGYYKQRIQEALAESRMALRNTHDFMEWYDRKAS